MLVTENGRIVKTLNLQDGNLPGYHMGYHLSSTFHNDGIQLVDINGQQVKALDRSYQNTFWLDPINGKVIKSQQYPAPGMPLITMTILKPFA